MSKLSLQEVPAMPTTDRTLQSIEQQLDANIPRDAVSSREGGGGRSLSYLTGHYVIDRLNQIFGPFGWASNTEEMRLVSSGPVERRGGSVHSAHYIAKVRLVVEVGGSRTEHNCTGYGNGFDKSDPGIAHELAVKEAETDALKRCAKNLGMSMGLALYSKDQENVEDAPVAKGPKATPAAPAPPDTGKVMEQITANSRVIIAKGGSKEGILADMKTRFGVDAKESLTPEQALEFLNVLKTQAKG